MAGVSVVDVTVSGTCVIARVSGEMDFTTRPDFQERFDELVARGERFIVLDLSGVTFCDSAGLNALLVGRLQADKREVEFVVACVPQHLRRILQMTGADQVLRSSETVAEAEAELALRGPAGGRA
ncbi:STAS domain-containing protein [Streptomyces sp. NPDC048275]|uniref:STAS domain-containing protein n=1 Tax=Streptomyces sp. NPDC048275 TaxID=3155629 RepID=UPI00340F4A85